MLGIWPVSAKAKDGVVGLIVALIIYVIVAAVGGWIIGFLAKIPGGLVGWIIGIAGGCLDLYCFIGIVIAILVFFKIVK